MTTRATVRAAVLGANARVVRIVRSALVSYDDPENRMINYAEYYRVESGVLPKDLYAHPELYGKARVQYSYLEFASEPTPLQVLREFEANHLQQPVIAEARYFHMENPRERDEGAVISLVGDLIKHGGAYRLVCHHASAGGMDLGWYWTSYHWRPGSRFLAVRKRLKSLK